MADNNQKLRIEIVTTADTKGAKDAADSVKQLTSDIDNLSPATSKYIEKLKEQEKQEEKNIAKKGEVRRGLREIGRELPIVGELGRMVMEPLIGAFVLLATVVKSALEAIEELGNRSTPAFKGLTEAVESQQDAMEAVELAARAYDRTLDQLAAKSNDVATASKIFMESAKNKSDSESKLNDASQHRQEAMLEAAEKMGLITHEQYIARKLALDEQYAAKRVELENKLEALQLTEKARERANTQIEADALQRSLAQKRLAAENASGKAEFTGGALSNDKNSLKTTEEKLEKLRAEQEELEYKTGIGSFTTTDPQYILEARKKQNAIEQENELATADKLRAKIKQDRHQDFDAKDQNNISNEDLHDTEERLRKAKSRIAQIDIELPGDQERTIRDINTRNQASGMDADTRALHSDPRNLLGPLPSDNAQIQKLSDTYKAHLAEYNASNIKGHKQSADAILDAKKQLDQEMANIRRELAATKSRGTTTQNFHGP